MNERLSAIIVDDEVMARNLLSGMLNEYCPQVELLESCGDLPSAVKLIRQLKPRIVFLDIELPGSSGLSILEHFLPDEITFSIVFTTAYSQYAIQAFKLAAVDYLLKPISPEDLESCIHRLQVRLDVQRYQALAQNLKSNGSKKLAIPGLSSMRFVDTEQILFLKADGAYTEIVFVDGTQITASKGLKHFEQSLSSLPDFFRCHKSYLVNIKHITEYVRSDGGYLIVKEKHQVSLSNDKVGMLMRRMEFQM
jgi:two-component system, LytTR family, response regulator